MRKPVVIGRFTFISSGVMILPGVSIGQGCVVGPNAVITQDIRDHSIVMGPSGRVVGSTLENDAAMLDLPGIGDTYYDPSLLSEMRARSKH